MHAGWLYFSGGSRSIEVVWAGRLLSSVPGGAGWTERHIKTGNKKETVPTSVCQGRVASFANTAGVEIALYTLSLTLPRGSAGESEDRIHCMPISQRVKYAT